MRRNEDYKIVFQYDDSVGIDFRYVFEYFGFENQQPINEFVKDFKRSYPAFSFLKVEDYK